MMRSLQHLRALAASRGALARVAGDAAFASASLAAAPASGAARGLRASAMRLGFGSHVSDNDPTVLELEKRRNLSKDSTLPGGGGVPDVPGWNEALASDSEAVVRPSRTSAARDCALAHGLHIHWVAACFVVCCGLAAARLCLCIARGASAQHRLA